MEGVKRTGSGRSPPSLPRILIIDHHDSYTLNVLLLLVSALKSKNGPPQSSFTATASNANSNSASEEDWISNLLNKNVLVLPHTHPYLSPKMFDRHLRNYLDAIILSPGPGSPERDDDFGTASRLIKHLSGGEDSPPSSSSSISCIPVFGICLGHQGLATVFGGSVKRARFIRHGTCSKIRWTKSFETGKVGMVGTVLEGVHEGTKVVRYNSLTVDPDSLPSCLRVTAWGLDSSSNSAPMPKSTRFSPFRSKATSEPCSPITSTSSPSSSSPRGLSDLGAPELLDSPLSPPSTAPASPNSIPSKTQVDGNDEGEAVILALEHKSLPFWGVQFHPESVESDGGSQIMTNYLVLVENWWIGRSSSNQEASSRVKRWERREGFPLQLRDLGGECVSLGESPRISQDKLMCTSSSSDKTNSWSILSRRFKKDEMPSKEKAPQVFESLFRFGGKKGKGIGSVWLDSARAQDPNSRYSYMSSPSISLSYYKKSHRISVSKKSKEGVLLASQLEIQDQDQQDSTQSFWSWMDQVQKSLQQETDLASCLIDLDSDDLSQGLEPPMINRRVKDLSLLRTGFVGYWGYEMWHESLKIDPSAFIPLQDETGNRPDAEFGFCDRVLALDSERDEWVAFAFVKTRDYPLSEKDALSDLQRTVASSDSLSNSNSSLGITSQEANTWFNEVASGLKSIAQSDHEEKASSESSTSRKRSKSGVSPCNLPRLKPDDGQEVYKEKVEAARDYIACGESYELCLTTQFRGLLPPLPSGFSANNSINVSSDRNLATDLDLDHFSMYRALRSRNPAPYSAFFHLPRLASCSNIRERSILCTSPERFMRISRSGEVEMKPIKGTLARAGWGKGEESMRPAGVDRAAGVRAGETDEQVKKQWREKEDEKRRRCLAADVKERAENLMIVDLIRAELLSFCLPSSVRVPALMKVESYATVHQLVTSVCGTLRPGIGPIEAQRRCHAPGSMTGAPKRRSMQILERLEPAGRAKGVTPSTYLTSSPQELQLGKRGIYSGTLGWIGVDGASDMAVVIRTAIVDGDDVSLGAGGAITYLSNPQKEWDEVLDKASALAELDLS